MANIVPTVGRKLYFFPIGDTSVHKLDDQPVDATIIYVWPKAPDSAGSQLLNLHVIDHTGTQQSKTSVPLIEDCEDSPTAQSYARWMPFQVGQAKAQAEPAPPAQPLAQEAPTTQSPTANVAQGETYSTDFGGALSALRNGKRVTRASWANPNVFVYFVPAAAYPAQTGVAKVHFGEGAQVPYLAYLALKRAVNDVVVFIPGMDSLLADDWQVL